MIEQNFNTLIKTLDKISENFTIDCSPGKFPIPVSDFSLNPEKVENWITSHTDEYQPVAREFMEKYITHVSYDTFITKCYDTTNKLHQSIINKLRVLADGEKLLVLLNLHEVDTYKSDNWVFSIMYRGLEQTGKGYLRDIFKTLLRSSKINIKESIFGGGNYKVIECNPY